VRAASRDSRTSDEELSLRSRAEGGIAGDPMAATHGLK
jgi:hypothetical protein